MSDLSIEITGRAAAFGGTCIVLAAAGAVMAARTFSSAHVFMLGLALVQLSAVVGVAGYFAGKRSTLDDAFEAGYQAGFHRGERVKPKVIRLPTDRSA